MPIPLYVLPAHGITEDRDNNLVTVFMVIEQFILRKHPGAVLGTPLEQVVPDVAPMTSGLIRVIAVWMKEDEDQGIEFEHQFGIAVQGQEQWGDISKFSFHPDKPLYRFIMASDGFLVPTEACQGYFVSRIRRMGTEKWTHSHRYPVNVILLHDPTGPSTQEKG
jgi:hypothetical protein